MKKGYRTIEEKNIEVIKIITSLQKLNLNPRDYEPIRELYRQMNEYKKENKDKKFRPYKGSSVDTTK